jgi:methionine-rich copper-binding protein CopC
MRIQPFVLCAALALLPTANASAHAFLDHADPRVGAVVKAAPATLRLTFTQTVEVPFCRVTVTGPPGFGGAGGVQATSGRPETLTVDLRGPSPPGAYMVHWRVLSVDTHVTEGDFSYQVRP